MPEANIIKVTKVPTMNFISGRNGTSAENSTAKLLTNNNCINAIGIIANQFKVGSYPMLAKIANINKKTKTVYTKSWPITTAGKKILGILI